MADAVTSTELVDNQRHYVIHLTNVSDGNGESAVTKVDVSALENGPRQDAKPGGVKLNKITYDIQGFTNVQLLWDATADDTMMVLGPGQGYMCFEKYGGLRNPRSTGFTGDVLLTTGGTATAGDTYDILLEFVKEE